MFKEFFNNCEIRDPVPVSEDQLKNIRSSLQKRLADNHSHPEKLTQEEKPMKKSTTIRTILLVATAAAVGAISLIGSANTVPVSELIAPNNGAAAETIVPEETDKLDDYDYFYAQMEKEHPNFPDKVKADFANFYAEIGRERLAEINDFYEQRLNEHLADEEKQIAERAEEERIVAELAGKNTVSEEFNTVCKIIIANGKTHSNYTPETITVEELDKLVTPTELDNLNLSPSYEDMNVTKLIVTETSYSDYKAMALNFTDWGITLKHSNPQGGGHSVLIHPDGNGGYQYYKYNDSAPIVDEQLLAAIAEGTEKYGDTFTIYY